MKKRRLPLIVALTLLGVARVPAAGPAPATMPTDLTESREVIDTARLIHDCLVQFYEKSSDKDTQYYEDGLWHFANEKGSEGRMSGPARAAAVLWVWQSQALAKNVLPPELQTQATPDKQAWLHRIAVDTFNRLIKDYQSEKGYFQEEATPATYFFAAELASTLLVLKDSLDKETRQLWTGTLVKEVEYMIGRNDLPNLEKGTEGWYTNGNIELGEAELLYKTWRATGDARYEKLFEAQWAHTIEPKKARMPGFGLFYTKQPTREDGSDGEGYLAETGGGATGYDASYAGVQLDMATSLYVSSHDPRALRLMNLLLNTALPRVDPVAWTYDASSGTRKNYRGMFYGPALAVAAFHGHRDDLKDRVAAQFAKAIRPQYLSAATQNWNHPNFYLGMGSEVAVLLEPYLADAPAK